MNPLPSGNACLAEAAGCWRRWARLAACNLLVLAQAFGAPGDLDTSFGTGGKVITAIGSGDDRGSSVAVQSDGKIVVAGYSWNGSNYDFALVRYAASGALDPGFGTGGRSITPIGTGDDYGQSLVVLSDGKIVVAGYSSNGSNHDFALVRYTAEGALDTSFGSGGSVTTAIGSGHDYGYSVAVQSDGKIVVAGSSSNGSNTDFALVRYTAAGALDASFGNGGKVTTDFGSSTDIGQSVAVQSDGKIVVAGYALTNGYLVALARYTPAGALDTSFGSGGKVTTWIGSSFNDRGYSVAVQSDGKIVVAGSSSNGSNTDFALVRYTASGTLDASFGNGGKVTTLISYPHSTARSVAVQSDGKIVGGGFSAGTGNGYDFALARYTSTGALDTSFGSGGKVTTDFGSNNDYGYSVALQSDGKIIVAGASYNGSNYDFALARYKGSGLASLANWRLTYFGTTNNSGNAADGAAPDGDGIVNLLKYGLVITPGSSGASSLPQGQRKVYAEGERLALVFLHDPARNDISLEVQAADDPNGPWTTVASSAGGAIFSGAGFVSETGAGGGLNTVEVRDLVNLDAAPHRYMHIKVTQ
jgi:uncharacterized delta-60 repeat protein